MAVVRIFLTTYRRNRLLRRSLASLIAQTFTDWICELHNDDPDDPFPADLVQQTGDPRITIHHHAVNWGATKTFNHVFAGGPEPYASLLEDDNWWDPGFLAAALATIESTPSASLVWANMRLWREEPDGGWTDTGRTVWAVAQGNPPVRTFRWPEALQAFDGLHSNGAMIFRPHAFRTMSLPAETPFTIIEPARERAANGELVLLTTPFANFAQTLQTARGHNPVLWLQSQLLVSASFFKTVTLDDAALVRLWARLRTMTPPNTNLLFLTAITLGLPRLLKPARPSDWLWFLLNIARHPRSNLGGLRFRRDHPTLWAWLLRHTETAPLRPPPLLLDKQAAPPVH